MIGASAPTAEWELARDAGIALLDQAAAEAATSLPKADGLDEAARYRLAAETRLRFARDCHLNTKARRLDLSEPWLLDIYADDARTKAVQKSVQVGISEYEVVYMLADAVAGRTGFMVQPTDTIRNRFVAQRVDRPLAFVPEYRKVRVESMGDTANRGLKQFGRGAMYFVGADTPRSMLEAAADTLIIDEIDRCNQENLALAPDRLEHADIPVVIRVGNPTHPEFGVNRAYLDSDQREWQVKCRACGRWQDLDFFANVLRVERDEKGEILSYELLDKEWRPELDRDVRFCCVKCGRPMDRLETDRKHCAWIARQPGRDAHGFRISHLMSKRKTLRGILDLFNKAQNSPSDMARFINNILGLAHSPSGSAITDEMLRAAERDFGLVQNSDGPCTMGIDVGSLWDVRISDEPAGADLPPGVRRARLIGRFAAMEPCIELIERFHVTSCVIDAKPELEMARRFQKAVQDKLAPGQPDWLVKRCDFHRGESLREPQLDPVEGTVKVDRTTIFDRALRELRTGRDLLPRGSEKLLGGDYWSQMKAPKRQLIEGARGEQRYVWTKGTDHQRLADVYDCLAAMVRPKPLQFTIICPEGDE